MASVWVVFIQDTYRKHCTYFIGNLSYLMLTNVMGGSICNKNACNLLADLRVIFPCCFYIVRVVSMSPENHNVEINMSICDVAYMQRKIIRVKYKNGVQVTLKVGLCTDP